MTEIPFDEIEFRKCLYCRTDIEAGRPNNTHFCNGMCQRKFSAGMSREKYHAAVDENRLLPIRGTKPPQKVRRQQQRQDSLRHVLCALHEYNLCNVVFTTHIVTKKACCYEHQVKYNDIKKQERRKASQNDN